MGDPAGIGPEICLRVVLNADVVKVCTPLIFGDASVLTSVSKKLDLPMPSAIFESDDREWQEADSPAVVQVGDKIVEKIQPGELSAVAGQSSYDFLIAAIDAAVQKNVAGICTAPINKAALHAAGLTYPGHTEILAERTSTREYCMLMTSDSISCCLVTTHVGLNDVSKLLTTEKIISAIRLSNDAMRVLRRRDPRMAICGLNPHAGEQGLFGKGEEEEIIQPAIEWARENGINLTGPLPSDTAFLPSRRKETDVYICMYHDQGLIPVKALAFDTAVNVTLGLPIVRTSVDHGTAFDIAWKGIAQPTSLESAIKMAATMALSRQGSA